MMERGLATDATLPQVLLSPLVDPDTPALHATEGVVITYGGLDAASGRLAQQLIGAGVRHGDRVVVQVQKSPMVVVLHLALLRCGAIQVPVNPDYREEEVRGFLEDAEPCLLVSDPSCPRIGGPWLSVSLDANGHGDLLELPDAQAELPVLSPGDAAAILFTSGTTGRPKGAVLSHRNLVHNACTLIDAWGFRPSDHLLHVLPLFHTHGLFVALHCVLGSGASLTLLPKFDAHAVVDALGARPAPTVMMGVPTHYSRLLESPRLSPGAVRSVRVFISGSAPMSPALHRAFTARTGHQILERYGMTETSMLTSNPLAGTRKVGSVGRPLPGVQVRLGAGSDGVGAVEVRGPNVFGGYWRRPELHAEVFTPDGWFRTGDLGRLDADGYLTLVGRSKDLVITGGMNVYPSDIEAVLDAIPGVRESAVVGLPDADLGERVVAAVVPEGGTVLDGTALRARARTRLAGYQLPKQIVVVPVLPRNAMGKVEKSTLRAVLAGDT